MSKEYFLSIADKQFTFSKLSLNKLFAKKPNFLDRPACYLIGDNHYVFAIVGNLENKLSKLELIGNPLKDRTIEIYDSNFNYLTTLNLKKLF